MANDNQLIDVSAAKGYVETFLADPILKMAANAVLNNTPRVEAKLVVHGRWIEHDDVCKRECSNCHWELHDDAAHEMYGDWKIKPKHCPECGAIMDGEPKDNGRPEV